MPRQNCNSMAVFTVTVYSVFTTVMGKFKKPVFDEVSKCYQIQWSDMAYLTESIVVDRMYVTPKE